MWKRMSLAGVVAAVLGVAGAVLAATGPSAPVTSTVTGTEHSSTETAPAPAADVEPQQRRSFATLTRPAAGEGRLPAAVAGSPGLSAFGGNPRLTRAAKASSGESLYVTPGAGALCLGDGTVNTCGAADAAVAGYLVAVRFCASGALPGQARLIGLVPDGIRSVDVVSALTVQEIAVRDNVYAATAMAPVRVAFTDAGGRRHEIPLTAPPGTACATGAG